MMVWAPANLREPAGAAASQSLDPVYRNTGGPSVTWAAPAPAARWPARCGPSLSGNLKGCLAGWQCKQAVAAIKLMLWAFYRCVK